jgi:predicted dehydrogenase
VSQLRVGLVGAGPWARRVHGPALALHPLTTLAAVWARRRPAAEEMAAEFGGRVHERFTDLLEDVDAVAFAVPPEVQAALAVRAATAGRHLICEKPLAGTVEDARAVARVVEQAGVRSAMVLTLRFDSVVQEWLAGVAAPAGPDTVGSARWLSGSLLGGPYASSSWRAEHGALLDIGPHVVDLLDTALGRVTGVDWAHHEEPDLWRFGLTHAAGARSSVTVSLRLPVDPSEVEFAVFGGAGRHRLAGRSVDAVACYTRLLDAFTGAASDGDAASLPDVARGLALQEIVEQVRLASA